MTNSYINPNLRKTNQNKSNQIYEIQNETKKCDNRVLNFKLKISRYDRKIQINLS